MKKLISSSVYKNDFKKLVLLANKLDCGIEISRFGLYAENVDLLNALEILKHNLEGFENEVTLHGFFFDLNAGSRDPEIQAISQKRFNQSFIIAKELGIKTVLFHSGYSPAFKHKDYQIEFAERNLLFWKDFIKKFEDNGMIAVIENVLEECPQKVLSMVHEINSPNLMVSLDTGHANVYSDVSVSEWIRTYGELLHHMHLHNNCCDDDSHNSILNGTLNFEKIFRTIKEENIKPKIVFEIFEEKALIESVNYFNEFFKQ